MDTRYLVTEEELKRFEVMTQVFNDSMTLKQDQEILGLSYRQALRIKKRFTLEGFEELLRKRPDTPQALKISTSLKEEIIL